MAEKKNVVVRAVKTVAKHVNVPAANKKVDQIIGEVVYGDKPPDKPK